MGFLRSLFNQGHVSKQRPAVGSAVREISAADLSARIDAGEAPLLIDVREQWEWNGGHLDDAVHVPLGELARRLSDFDRAAPIVVYCHLGQRSWYAAAQMQQAGFEQVMSLAGGIEAWQGRLRAGNSIRK